MQCVHCGNSELQRGHRFCFACGSPVDIRASLPQSLNPTEESFETSSASSDENNQLRNQIDGVYREKDRATRQPSADEKGTTQSGEDGKGTTEPGEDGKRTTPTGADGKGSTQLGEDGKETTPSGADGKGTTQAGIDGKETTEPIADARGTMPPGAHRKETTPAGVDRKGTTPSGVDEKESTTPGADGEGPTQPGADGKGTAPPGADGKGTTQPGADGKGTTQLGEDGNGAIPPIADGKGTTQPGVEGKETTPSDADGKGTAPPGVDGNGTTPANANGKGATPTVADGKETTPLGTVGKGTTQLSLDRKETTQPSADAKGTIPPGAHGKETTPAGVDEKGTTPSGADEKESIPPGADRKGITQPGADGKGTAPPGADGKGTTQPGADGKETTQLGEDGNGTIPPITDGKGTTQPGVEGKETTPSGADGKGTTQAGIDGKETTQPSADTKGTIPPGAHGKETTPSGTDVKESTPTVADGKGTAPPGADGKETTPLGADGKRITSPGGDGKGNTQPNDKGKGTTPPSEDGKGTIHPGAHGKGTSIPVADGKGTTPPGADRKGTTPPGADGKGTTPPGADGKGTTPPGANGKETTPPGADGKGTTPPGADGKGTTPSNADGKGTAPPAADGKRTTPLGADGKGTTPPGDDRKGTTPPDDNGKGTTPPCEDGKGTKPPGVDGKGTTLPGADGKGTTPSGTDGKGTKQPSAGRGGKADTEQVVQESTSKLNKGNELINVTFHTILSPAFQFNPEKDKVCLRCGLNKWKSYKEIDIDFLRSRNDGFCVLEGKAEFTLQQASHGTPYKYVVTKQENVGKYKEHWECLIGFSPTVGKHVNRCLIIPEKYLKPKGVWHQYDDPVHSDPGWFAYMCHYVPFLAQTVRDPSEGRRMAMLSMLPDLEECSLEAGKMKASAILDKMNNVFYCMSKALCEDGGKIFPRDPHGFDARKVLLLYMDRRLIWNIQVIQTGDNRAQAKRLATSVIIASAVVVHELTHLLTCDQLRDLFESLRLHVTPGTKICSEFDALQEHFSASQLGTVAHSLLQLCFYVIDNRSDVSPLLYAVPLLHFLFKTSEPFSHSVLSAIPSLKDYSWWGTQALEFQRLREQTSSSATSSGSVISLLPSLKDMFELDPLFKRTFLLALPISDIVKVLQQAIFPLHEVCWTLQRVVKDRKNPRLSDKEWESLKGCVNTMRQRIGRFEIRDAYWRQEPFSQSDELMSLATAASQLLKDLMDIDSSVIKKKTSLVCGLLCLLSQSLVLTKRSFQAETVSTSSEDKIIMSKDLFLETHESLRGCLEKTFGTRLSRPLHEEFQVWSELLSLKTDDEELQRLWDSKMCENLNNRVTKLNQEDVVDLYCTLDLSHNHQKIHECLSVSAFQSTEYFDEDEIKRDLTKEQTTKIGKLFTKMLKHFWPKSSGGTEPPEYDILVHILSWKPMDYYFKHFGEGSPLRANLPEEGQTLLAQTFTRLENVASRIKNSEITVRILLLIQEHSDRFLELHSLSTKEEAGKEIQRMKDWLGLRMEDLQAFEREKETLKSFLDMISQIDSAKIDTSAMKDKVSEDVSCRRILDLCHKHSPNGEPMVTFFQISPKIKRMFDQLHRIKSSVIFQGLWHKCGTKALELFSEEDKSFIGSFSVDQVQEKIWKLAFNRWRSLWEVVLDGDISLKDVDSQFEKIGHDDQTFQKEIETALDLLAAGNEDLEHVLRQRTMQIKQCQKLRESLEAAQRVWEFKEEMKLKGDFAILNDIRNQMDSEFCRRFLSSINDDFLKAGKALESLTKPRVDCLAAVVQCRDYIAWLREEVKGRDEVKTLVDLAMMSSGESDMESDRVSCLHSTALGFAPFIFDLSEESGFHELMESCDKVWKELDADINLPSKLEDINRHLEWVKAIKDAHAMSSLKLAEAMNNRGVYHIGQSDGDEEATQPYDKKTLESVVYLMVPPSNGDGVDKKYRLDELKDLQSKLVLIAGKKSKGQEEVERFGEILQSVIRLAQAFVSLIEIGDVSHLEWSEEFHCKPIAGKDVMVKLRKQSDDFEKCYKVCKENIGSQRSKYTELNYFTTQQLLFLRKELAAVRRSQNLDYLDLQVYALLQKVHPEVHPSTLRDALCDAGFMRQVDDSVHDYTAWNESVESEPTVEAGHRSIADKIGEKYELLFDNVEKLGYTERVAVAALVAESDKSVAELVVWCVKNNDKENFIEDLYQTATTDPRFRYIFPQERETHSSLSSLDSDDDDESNATDETGEEIPPQEIELDQTRGGSYLSLEELGVFLSHLADPSEGVAIRQLPGYLQRGKPNLIIASRDEIFAAVLGLFMDDMEQSLPSADEVLICSSTTSAEEVELIFRRALADEGQRFYCLVSADSLDYDVSRKAVDCLLTLMQDYQKNKEFGLVILCSKENEDRSYMVSSLEEFKVAGMPRHPRPEEIRDYLEKRFETPPQRPGSYRGQLFIWSAAGEAGRGERLTTTRVVTSARAGVGKSLVVQRLTDQVSNLPNNPAITELLKAQNQEYPLCLTIPLHDKHVRVSDIVGFFLPHAIHADVPLSRIFHLDVSPSMSSELETLLFNLLILGELTDDKGRVWRRNPFDLYIVEITDPTDPGNKRSWERKLEDKGRKVWLHQLLPAIRCIDPKETWKVLRRKGQGDDEANPLFDEQEFQSEGVQRVFQYLQGFDLEESFIEEFSFDDNFISGTVSECVDSLIRNCGVDNPSWMELRHFVSFLNSQLCDCERSPFCSKEMVGDTLEGFRTFVVKFMIHMSRDFATRSLNEEKKKRGGDDDDDDDDDGDGDDGDDDIRHFELKRHWENSPHPYLFFNRPDCVTFTFLGFQIDPEGNLIDPETREVLQEKLISRRLRTGLEVQKVNLDQDFESKTKLEKIGDLCSVMGLEWVSDPDINYELTGDNVKKILAIHMRFRCNIPVVIMGETGCGKTRLIRYMCGLQTGGRGFHSCKNMRLMKIHGGTTYSDIKENVRMAEEMAKRNETRYIDTVLFFDEANTTDALGMIKEIMVDRRCNGRPLSDSLKFIVACNPYRRHTDEMIKKLESAGLGYHVRAERTTERFGHIPLRHLVYRVHALPESMRCLVWDFGQLQPEVEERYTRLIVRRHVIHEGCFRGLGSDEEKEKLVDAIAAVLAASQQFMREREDECSFVSLRDVKRAMEVMVWFYEHYKTFQSLLQQKPNRGEHSQSSDEGDESEEDGEEDVESDDEVEQRESASEVAKAVLTRIPQTTASAKPVSSVAEGIIEAGTEGGSWFELLRQQIASEEDSSSTFVNGSFTAREHTVDMEKETVSDDIDRITWSLILALGVCYQAKLQEREEYRNRIADIFRTPCNLPGGAPRIEQEISRFQGIVLNALQLGPNIARNTALRENVFMMVVCIELRIPLFVVGKPGSSKSLAKTVVADNMQGQASKSELFSSFKQIQLVSYQCSPQSTPEGIKETFRQCRELQRNKNKDCSKTTGRTTDRFASVVVLDEVGLAEDSPKMPLKTLHPLLEDDDGGDDVIETEERPERVAFIGLSNWALDPAKMNRGIMLRRNEPGVNELEQTARGICSSDEKTLELVEPMIRPLVRGYNDLYNKQKNLKVLQDGKKDEFFGLRDFYSLVKMVCHIAKEKQRKPDWQEIEHAIRRNFGGLDVEEFKPVDILIQHLGFPLNYLQDKQARRGLDPVDLIRASLDRENQEGESRYLLILTENFAALPVVKQLLTEVPDSEEPYVIFGSSFPNDQLFTQVCRNINRIKICMETGRTVVLLNLENLYESLYDALNQYYVYFGGEKYVDLGLGNHRVKCRVHKNFRLIVIAEKDVVYNKFPIPLINRLEKHFLVMSTSLTEPQKELTEILKAWAEDFAHVCHQLHEQGSSFQPGDAFVGYHEDSVPATVLQVCNEIRRRESGTDEDSEDWRKEVLKSCQERLLKCATPDAVTRLSRSRLADHARELRFSYFHAQEHSSLAAFIGRELITNNRRIRAQITTHSRLLSENDLSAIAEAAKLPDSCVKCFTLQQFQTEQQFCNSIGGFFARHGGMDSLLIVQCGSTDQTLNLIPCARHLLIEEWRKIGDEELDADLTCDSHILVVIQLARVAGGSPTFVGVQGEGWLSVHIDELCPPAEEVPSIEALSNRSVSEIFGNALYEDEKNLNVNKLLISCVQEAARSIDDKEATLGRATKRIEVLLRLLSPETGVPQGEELSFATVLAERIHKLLVQKDKRAANGGTKWLESEAISGSSVREIGTFKKVSWLRFQSVIAPILAEVVAYVDRDGNLDLAASADSSLRDLWLTIFQTRSDTDLYYDAFLVEEGGRDVARSVIPVLKSGYRSHTFQCEFPFSWLIKEHIDNLKPEAKAIAVRSHETVSECLRKLIASSEVGPILGKFYLVEDQRNSLVARYLHDFAHMVYVPVEDPEELMIKVVERAITVAAREIHGTSHEEFILDFALVHTGHSHIHQRLGFLSQLVRAVPDIMQDLLKSFRGEEREMTVDAIALQMCLERLAPRRECMEDSSRRQEWCDIVLSVRTPLEALLSSSRPRGDVKHIEFGEKTIAILTECRYAWQRLSAVRMFIEHVYPAQTPTDSDDVDRILRLWKALGDRTDFSKADSVRVIQRFLVSCSEDSVKQISDDNPEEHVGYLNRCNSFFMELVSVFCFGDANDELDSELFEMLMQFVTGTRSNQTKEFSPFPEFEADASPVVRSFLLQQLVSSSARARTAKQHLERFLFEAQGLSSEVSHLLQVCLLTVQCMENSLASGFAKQSALDLPVRIAIVQKLCEDTYNVLWKNDTSPDEMQVDSLDAVAKLRYALSLTAEFIYLTCVSEEAPWTDRQTRDSLSHLFDVVKKNCTSGNSTGPPLFLLKQLVKRYGGHSITTVSQNRQFGWIVPSELQRKVKDDQVFPDTFLVYGERYRQLRDLLARALLSENFDELLALIEEMEHEVPQHAKDVILLLAIYSEVTVPLNTEEERSLIPRGALTLLKDTILRSRRRLSAVARTLATRFLDTPEGFGFPSMTIQHAHEEKRALAEIVIHASTVLQCIDFDLLLGPLRMLISAPEHMLDSFLPTMPEDSFQEAKAALKEGGKWYQCPAGHPYFVGDCGRPDYKRYCPECAYSVPIGGIRHQLEPENRPIKPREDRSNKGHVLGSPQIVQPERDLSPSMISLMRAILHSVMIAGGHQRPEIITQFMQPEVCAEDACNFLWEHLHNDVKNLSVSLERSVDEVILAIHLVLSEIVYRATDEREADFNWSNKEARKMWELAFLKSYMTPVVENLEERRKTYFDLSVNDRRLGNDPLMREIYEVDKPLIPRTPSDIHPGHAAFWRYRPRLTVEHVICQFQGIKGVNRKFRVLEKFFAEEQKLRAVRYLPDVVALQKLLMDRYHQRIDRKRAEQLKINVVMQELSKDKKVAFPKLFQSFRQAWDLVRTHLKPTGRDVASSELFSKSVDKKCPMAVLLPTEKGPGICCKRMLSFLVNIHNELVQAYHSAISTDDKARKLDRIPLSEVSLSQLIAYDPERDLLPLILANCSYSLEVGKETHLQYNWDALERQLIDRFIRGRPEVDSMVEQFTFIEDDRKFDALKAKIPQEPLPATVRAQILSEMRDLSDISDIRRHLEIAIGFLSKAGGEPTLKISEYLRDVLRLGKDVWSLKNKKAQQHCGLSHILDFWRTLSLARAMLLFNNKQDPFDQVPDHFKTEMPNTLVNKFSSALKKVEVDSFLSKVLEVINLRLPQEEENIGDMSLKEFILMSLDENDTIPGLDDIPENICVKHAVPAWELALERSHKDRARRQLMMT